MQWWLERQLNAARHVRQQRAGLWRSAGRDDRHVPADVWGACASGA